MRLTAAGGSEQLAQRDLGTIEPGQQKTFPLTTRPGRGAAELRVRAAAEAVCARPVQDEAAVAIRTIPAIQVECVDAADPVRAGEDTRYTIAVRNEGSGPDTNTVEVRAQRPGDVRFRVDVDTDSLDQVATQTEPTRVIQ